ncbi:MAG: methyltransferase domain-containing protein [Planctomycetota bacterium]|nr:methyltransferase domain-containing protein [Planctomycetota bacterium]
MALHCPKEIDIHELRRGVREMYKRVAQEPGGEFHFHRGPEYASRWLGYGAAELGRLPREATTPFAGVGHPLAAAPLTEGSVVLDIGCGAGMELLLAAQRTGPTGLAIGVDMTAEMLECAGRAVVSSGLQNVELRKGNAEALPVLDASIDVVISNGVLNLAPDKHAVYSEIARVLKPGGRLQLADIFIERALPEGAAADIDLWAG